MVIVGGGDGSLSESIDDFVGTDTVFALLPLGTANSFARTMGIPLDLDGAIEVIAKGRPLHASTSARSTTIISSTMPRWAWRRWSRRRVPHGLKRKLGRFGYLLWAGWSAASFNAFRLKIVNDGKVNRMWATEVRIANGRFHGGVELIEKADVESGEIIVQAVRGRSLVRLGLNYAREHAQAALGAARRCANSTAASCEISTRPQMRVSIDGELGPETPFTAEVAEAAVTIAAPRRSRRRPGSSSAALRSGLSPGLRRGTSPTAPAPPPAARPRRRGRHGRRGPFPPLRAWRARRKPGWRGARRGESRSFSAASTAFLRRDALGVEVDRAFEREGDRSRRRRAICAALRWRGIRVAHRARRRLAMRASVA